jgi:hypothetical protein
MVVHEKRGLLDRESSAQRVYEELENVPTSSLSDRGPTTSALIRPPFPSRTQIICWLWTPLGRGRARVDDT